MGIIVDGATRTGCVISDGNARTLSVDGSPRCDSPIEFRFATNQVLDPTLARIEFQPTGVIATESDSNPFIPNWTGTWHDDGPQGGLGAGFEIRYSYASGSTISGIVTTDPSIAGMTPGVYTSWVSLAQLRFAQMNTGQSSVFIPDELTLTVQIRPAGGGNVITQTFYIADG